MRDSKCSSLNSIFLHLLTRLWDYFSDREERSLDSYWGESSSNEEGSSEQIHGDRDWFWLTYEPDIDDLDFL